MKTYARKQNLKNKCKQLNFFILIMCITCISNAQNEGWHSLPFVPSQTLWDIHCINKDTVIAVGDNGYIIRTTNGGSHWDSIYSTTNNTLYKITFVNDSVGYICGKNGTVLKTENSGLTWSNIGISTSLNLLSMSFINQDTGWIVGGNGYYPYYLYGNKGILIKTYNGGFSWEIDTSINRTYTSVFFINKDVGFFSQSFDTNSILIGNYAILYKTINGGISWTVINQDTLLNLGYYTDIVFFSPQIGYYTSSAIYTENEAGLFKTTDSGQTWNRIVECWSMRKSYIIDSCKLYISYADMPGSGSKYEDLCQEYTEEFFYFNGMHLLNEDYGFCVGRKEIFGQFRHCIYKKGQFDNIEEFEKSTIFNLAPNPCNDISTLSANGLTDVSSLDIIVYNTLGQKINANIQVNDKGIHIDLSKGKSGVYIVSIRDKNRIIENCKIIKL